MNRFLIFIFLLINLPAFGLNDFLADEIKNAQKPFVNLNYDYTSTRQVPISLRIVDSISTKDENLYEGKKIKFTVASDSYCNSKIIAKRGDIVEGRISHIISSGFNGIPYSIIIEDFEIPNIPKSQLKAKYQKDGFNRTYFVLPLKWALTPLPPTGSLTNFIFGGHAKITKKDKITLYYYPEWQ